MSIRYVPPRCGQLCATFSDFSRFGDLKRDRETKCERRGRRGIYYYNLQDKTPLYTPLPYTYKGGKGREETGTEREGYEILQSEGE